MSEETDSSTVQENYYRATLVWPVSTERCDVTEWLYVISLSLDHVAVSKVSPRPLFSIYTILLIFQNTLEWMEKRYQAFNWTYTKKRKIELDPGTSTFIIAPEIVEVISIKGGDTVSYYSLHIYMHVHRCTFF